MKDVAADFERIMSRPADYFQRRLPEQWEIDEQLGILDVDLRWSDLTEDQQRQYTEKYKK